MGDSVYNPQCPIVRFLYMSNYIIFFKGLLLSTSLSENGGFCGEVWWEIKVAKKKYIIMDLFLLVFATIRIG